MINGLMLLCALVCLSAAQDDRQVRNYILNDANLIETSRGYAINAPTLLANNWKAVSINGDSVQAYSPTCQLSSMNKQELVGVMGQANLIDSAKQALYAVESGQNQLGGATMRMGVTRFALDYNSVSTSMSRNLAVSSFSSNGLSVTKLDDNSLMVAKPAGMLPDNINRVFMSNDLVTFVYQDGRVLMKPSACLTSNEQMLVQQLRAEAQEAKRKFDLSMQQFQRNMHNMQRNMQMQNMNMQQHLQNMFPPGFPFYNNNQFMRPQNNNAFGSGFASGNQGGAGGMANGGAGSYAQANAGANWPFGQTNNPFYPGFPFGRQ